MTPRFDWESDEYPVSDDIDPATFQMLIAYENREVVGVFKDRRLALRPKRGGAEQVGFVDQELPFLKDALIVHNHPYGVLEPLSGDAAFVAASNDAAEIERWARAEESINSSDRKEAGPKRRGSETRATARF